MSVLDEIIAGVRDDLARRQAAVPGGRPAGRPGRRPRARDPMPAFRAPGSA